MKTVIRYCAFTAAILTLTVCTAKCALTNEEVKAAPITRIDAPDVSQWTYTYVRGNATARKEVSTIRKESAKKCLNAFELMYDLPLSDDVQVEIDAMCTARDVNPAVVLAIIYHESSYREDAVGDNCNSYGLMQVQPRWHADRMARLGVTDLLDGVQNVRVGVDYLDELLDRYGGDYYKALTAYNAGHYKGTVSRYAYLVMEEAQRICSE